MTLARPLQQGVAASASSSTATLFQPSSSIGAELSLTWDFPQSSVYYVLDPREKERVRTELFNAVWATFPYGLPPNPILLSTQNVQGGISRKTIQAEVQNILNAWNPGMAVAATQVPLQYVIVNGQPMCINSFVLTNAVGTPQWTSVESAAGTVSVQVKVSVGINE